LNHEQLTERRTSQNESDDGRTKEALECGSKLAYSKGFASGKKHVPLGETPALPDTPGSNMHWECPI
jgi:hypothetical protein